MEPTTITTIVIPNPTHILIGGIVIGIGIGVGGVYAAKKVAPHISAVIAKYKKTEATPVAEPAAVAPVAAEPAAVEAKVVTVPVKVVTAKSVSAAVEVEAAPVAAA
jgi:hypothetical protein